MINYFLYQLGIFIATHMPLKLAYVVAVFFSDVHYIFAKKDRQNVYNNLSIIFPEKSGPEICKIRLSMYRNFAKYLVDFFRFSIMDRGFIEKNVKLENRHIVDNCLKEGKGVIALTAHIGNWELGGAMMGILGYNFWAVALEHKEKKVNDFFNAQRKSKNINVIPYGKASLQCARVLKQNAVLALVGDRDFSEKGLILELFGKPCYFPEGPAAFHIMTKAAIVPGFMVRNPDDTFTLRFEKPLEIKLTDDKRKDIAEIIKEYTVIFENYIRKYPDQWYMFRRFWIA